MPIFLIGSFWDELSRDEIRIVVNKDGDYRDASGFEDIELDSVKSQGYSFQIEMNFRAWAMNAKIKECPIIFVDRTIGESKMSKSIMFEAIWVVWRLRVLKIFKWF